MRDADFIPIIAGFPDVFCRKMSRSGSWRIFYKPGSRYAHSWDIWIHVKFIYETVKLRSIYPNDVHLQVFEKYIEVF